MAPYRARNLGGIEGTGTYARPSGPDYSGAIDSLVNAFASTREAVIQRAAMQQRADAARAEQARQQQSLEIQQKRLELDTAAQERSAAEAHMKAIGAGYKVQDPNAPVTATGEPQPTMKLNGQSYVLDPTATPEARKKAEADTAWQTQRKAIIAAGVPEDRVDAARGNEALVREWLNPTPRGPARGTPEALAIIDAEESVRDRHQGGRGGGAAGGEDEVTAGDARKTAQAEKFAKRQVEAHGGDPVKAVAYVESHPAMKKEAVKLGLTESHYNAAATEFAKGKKTAKAPTDDDALVEAWLNGPSKKK